jgi:hypothetical protein
MTTMAGKRPVDPNAATAEVIKATTYTIVSVMPSMPHREALKLSSSVQAKRMDAWSLDHCIFIRRSGGP